MSSARTVCHLTTPYIYNRKGSKDVHERYSKELSTSGIYTMSITPDSIDQERHARDMLTDIHSHID